MITMGVHNHLSNGRAAKSLYSRGLKKLRTIILKHFWSKDFEDENKNNWFV